MSGKLSDGEIVEVANDIFAQNRISGTYKNYVYSSTVIDDSLNIAFIDISEIIKRERLSLLNLVLLGIVILTVLTIGSVPVSAVLVKPLEEAIRRQSEFIQMAEHELKTPIAVMNTSLSMLEKDGVKSKYLEYARTENDKMKRLVSELLELSRAEQEDRVNKTYKVIDLSNCVEGASLVFESLAYEKGVIFEAIIDPAITLPADDAQIDRLVGILIDNAIKHTEAGKRVVVDLHKTDSQGGRIVLGIKNEGEPIPEDEREKIFEPFYRIDKARNRDEGRYGLGLSIASAIVKSHGGEISVGYENGYTIFNIIFS